MSSPPATQPRGTAPACAVQAPAEPAPGGIDRELRWFRGALGLCFLSTLLLSRRAWLSSGRDYPLVPVVDGLPQPPFPLDWLLFAAMAAALLGMSFARRPRPYLVVVLCIAGAWALLDQTRWQPYLLTYVAGTGCLLLGEMRGVRAPGDPPRRWHMAPFQLSLCAMWTWSGVHKFNLVYLTHDFPLLMRPVALRLGIGAAEAPRVLLWAGLASAAVEAALGAALLWPRTRRAAVAGLTLMHGFLMLVLGPLGYASNTVVWPWNAAVVAALWLLFWPRAAAARFDGFVRGWWMRLRRRAGPEIPRPLRLGWWMAVVCFGLLPALSFAGWWDASLSFQMYAGKQRYVLIDYHPAQRGALPAAALQGQRRTGQVDLVTWSMRELNVFPVMETRVVTRIGRAVALRAPRAEVRVRIAGPPSVIQGERDFRAFVYEGPEQIPREIPYRR
ncbi:MAG TPA: hypothetical protein VHG93_10915 [Longimicrobium sp.]|nr:hypothetical protein [Longimicrobium sp.]